MIKQMSWNIFKKTYEKTNKQQITYQKQNNLLF